VLRMRTRRNISLVLFIGLLLVSALVWSMSTNVVAMQDGLYAGVAQGFGGDLVVDVTIADGKISEVAVRPHQETPMVAGPAIEKLTASVVDAQSAEIDTVSGATVTSNAFIAAVEQALQKAQGNYEDGVYAGIAQGFGGDLIVDVTVSEGRISEVEVRPHQETPAIAGPAIEQLTATIVESQSFDVEAVSGATYTSNALVVAVKDALHGTGVVEPASEPFEIDLADGTYRGRAKGFGGELVLDVTIADNTITEIVVVSSNETPFIAEGAFKELIPAIIETQGKVDAVSGATATSGAVLAAVEDALSGDEAVEAAASAGFAINVGDGTHRGSAEGFGGKLVLDVTVADGKITEIEVVEHSDTPFIADPAIEKLLPAIVEAQGPVDAVSGATATSKAVLAAVEQAVSGAVEEPAASPTYEISVGDGTHRGSAEGFGGKLVLDVTVAEGKITEIEVVEHSDTPFIADPAIEKLLPAIVEAQGPVDTVSGATATSKAVLAAVEQAVSGAVEEPAASPTYEISVGDGTHRGSAEGFGGELIVEVTVTDGKITEIAVVEHNDTPFIAENAVKQLPPAIIEAQGPVDVVSNATVTSKAILSAVEAAVTKQD